MIIVETTKQLRVPLGQLPGIYCIMIVTSKVIVRSSSSASFSVLDCSCAKTSIKSFSIVLKTFTKIWNTKTYWDIWPHNAISHIIMHPETSEERNPLYRRLRRKIWCLIFVKMFNNCSRISNIKTLWTQMGPSRHLIPLVEMIAESHMDTLGSSFSIWALWVSGLHRQ